MYEVYTSTNVLYRRNITYIQRNIFFVAIFLRPRIRWERPLMQTRTKQQQSMNCKKEKIKTKKNVQFAVGYVHHVGMQNEKTKMMS